MNKIGIRKSMLACVVGSILSLTLMASKAWAQEDEEEVSSGDDNVAEAVVDALVGAVEGGASAAGAAATVFFTPSETAGPELSECQGNNCTEGFPSNVESSDNSASSSSEDESVELSPRLP